MSQISKIKSIALFDGGKLVGEYPDPFRMVLDIESGFFADELIPAEQFDRVLIAFEDTEDVLDLSAAEGLKVLLRDLARRAVGKAVYQHVYVPSIVAMVVALAQSIDPEASFSVPVTEDNPASLVHRETWEALYVGVQQMCAVVRKHIDKLEEAAKQTK